MSETKFIISEDMVRTER